MGDQVLTHSLEPFSLNHSLTKSLYHTNSLSRLINVAVFVIFRTVSRTTICDEIKLAVDIFKLSRDELWEVISNGFESSFMPGSYANKLV